MRPLNYFKILVVGLVSIFAIGLPSSVSGQESDAETQPTAAQEYDEAVTKQVRRVLKTYDKDKSGALEADEIKDAPWGSPAPSESDQDDDGVLTEKELAERYKARFASQKETTSPRPENDVKSPSQRNRIEAYVKSLIEQYDEDGDGRLGEDEVKKMRQPPKDADADADGFVSASELVNAITGTIQDRRSRPHSQSRRTTEARPQSTRTRRSTSAVADTKVVQIEFHLVQLSDGIDAAKLKQLAEMISQSGESSLSVLLSKESVDSVISHDQVYMKMMSGREFNYQTGSQQSQVIGPARSRSGQSVSQYRKVDVGLRLSLVPEIVGDHIRLNMELEKSFIDTPKSTPEAKQGSPPDPIGSVRLETTLFVPNGRSVASVLSGDQRQWLVFASARFE